MNYMDAFRCDKCGAHYEAGDAHECAPPPEPLQVFDNLTSANKARQVLWNKGGSTNGPLYAAVELGGEIGEAIEVAQDLLLQLAAKSGKLQNTVKKLEREDRGLAGSRATIDDLRDEIGDVLICVSLLAIEYGIDAHRCAARKFNKTSRKLGFPVFMDEGPVNADRTGT